MRNVKGCFFALGLCTLMHLSNGQTKKVCITVDDLPAVTYGIKDYEFALELTRGLIRSFNEYDVPAIGYVNESKLYRNGLLDSLQVGLLNLWLQNGLDIGNHTFSHLNYHRVAFEEYAQDIIKGERIIKRLAANYGKEVKFFRHPYLRSGRDQLHADSLLTFLAARGYTEAPVTIDNDDYLFALAYSRASKKADRSLMKKIGEDYILYMEQKLLFYENSSEKLFDRNMAHTLLIHANHLNSQYLDELLEMYQKHGYTFVSQADVLTDPAYQEEVTVFGDWGISWIDRWALSKKKNEGFFKDDPKTPEYIREMTR